MATTKTKVAPVSKGKSRTKVPATSKPRAKNVPAKAKEPPRAFHHATGMLIPAFNAAGVIEAYSSNILEDVKCVDVWRALRPQIEEVQAGDTKQVEAMLFAQAEALQTIFVSSARRAQAQEYQAHLEAFFKMALRAQNQCRMTLETLATIQNPPTAFIRQQNVGFNQQVNNGAAPPARGKNKNQPNELLSEGTQHGETLDAGGTSTAGAVNSTVETVGAIQRPQNGHG